MPGEDRCQCWGCRSPKILHKTDIPSFLSDCYALCHSIPVVLKHLQGRWFVFKDAPQVTVALWAGRELEDDDPEDFKTLVRAARDEIKAREVRNA